jgi:hypothetical protein
MVTDRLTDQEVRMLAQAFSRPASATALLEQVGLDRSQQPAWTERTALEFWREINHLLGLGAIIDGRQFILAAALKFYPGNQVFHDGVASPPSATTTTTTTTTDHRTAPSGAQGAWGQARAAVPAVARSGPTRDPTGPAGVLVALDPVLAGSAGAVVPAGWDGLRELIEQAAQASGLAADAVRPRLRGPCLVAEITGDVPTGTIAALVRAISGALTTYNATGASHRVRLRMALHRGRVGGVVGGEAMESTAGDTAAVMYRLVDAPPLSRLLEHEPASDVVLLVSSALTESGTSGADLAELLIDPRQVTVDIPGLPVTARVGAVRAPAGLEAGEQGPAGRPNGASASEAGRVGRLGFPGAAAQSWDFVISAAKEDSDWSAWLAWELEASHLRVHLQAWDVLPGHHVGAQLHAAISNSKRMLMVLSPAYLDSPQVQAEWTAVWAGDLNGVERRLVPVRIETCEPGGLLRGISYIDLAGLSGDAAKAAFHQGIDASIRGWYRPESAPPFPGPRP